MPKIQPKKSKTTRGRKRTTRLARLRSGLLARPKLSLVLLTILTVAVAGLGFWYVSSRASVTAPIGSSSTCGARVSGYSFQRLYDKTMPWNIPVCAPGMQKYAQSDDYRDRLWYFSRAPRAGNASEKARSAANRGQFKTYFGFDANTDYSSPVYYAKDATTTIRVQVCGQAYCIPSNLDSDDYNVKIGQGKGYLPDTSIPWNPKWKAAAAKDRELTILDDRTSPAKEINLWGLAANDIDAIGTCGLFRDTSRLCTYSTSVIRTATGEVADYKTSNTLGGRRGMGIQEAPMTITPDEVAQGEIRQALYMEAYNTMTGPECTPAQLATNNYTSVIGKVCGFAVAPSTQFEWKGATDVSRAQPGLEPNCKDAKTSIDYETGLSLVDQVKLPQMIPSGMRFAITNTDAEIEAWLNRRGYTGTKRQTAKIFAVALRDYGWFVGDTTCSDVGFALAGIRNESDKAKWASLGLTDGSAETLLEGLFEREKIYTVAPPQNQCLDGTKSTFYCKASTSFYPAVIGGKTPTPTALPSPSVLGVPNPTKTPTPSPSSEPTPILLQDKVAPTPPTKIGPSLMFDPFKGQYYLQVDWNEGKDDQAGALRYVVERNGALVNNSGQTSRSYKDYSIKPDTLYTYKVKAIDLAGNASTSSSPSTLTIRCLWIFCSIQ